jgi:two-component system chemotaxis sensor kinase CheA
MNPLLEQFLSEAREFLQGIGEKLMGLESDPHSDPLMTELFRLVHTLKGNSGLFEFPEMTRVLHASEDLLDAVRDARVDYSRTLADRLLAAMDFVSALLDEIEADGRCGPDHAETSARLAQALRALIADAAGGNAPTPRGPAAGALATAGATTGTTGGGSPSSHDAAIDNLLDRGAVPETLRMELFRKALAGSPLWWLDYKPDAECFFAGQDPLFQARQIPAVVWTRVEPTGPWPKLGDLDAYRCQLVFRVLTTAAAAELRHLFRYTPGELTLTAVPPQALAIPQGIRKGEKGDDEFVDDALARLANGDRQGLERAARTLLERSAPELWRSSAVRWLLLLLEVAPDQHAAQRALIESLRTTAPPAAGGIAPAPAPAPPTAPAAVSPRSDPATDALVRDAIAAQREILSLPVAAASLPGRLQAVAATLAGCLVARQQRAAQPRLDAVLEQALTLAQAAPLLAWLEAELPLIGPAADATAACSVPVAKPGTADRRGDRPAAAGTGDGSEAEVKFGRRADDAYVGAKHLKVDQAKIDRLMNLIGEMVVAKNSLPYLAARAETQYGVRELSREIKGEHAVINRIAEEMQDAIMQVRMMPLSFVFQRFPRLVRDTSRKLGKEVQLVVEGEETEADKTIVEALADPLIHIIRNSLDHGLELPAQRTAAGKAEAGRLTIRASQESDRVVIEVADDGKGIDPAVIKRKALERGLIDQATSERLTDQEAVNLVFAAGFSTAESVSDLSGRGVGLDVVRNAMEKAGGTVDLASEAGKGTRIRLALPLSMAVTNAIVIESAGQIFGVPMDTVVETVRVPRTAIHTIKHSRTTALRGRIIPLRSLNDLLAVPAEQIPNDDGDFATLVVRAQGEHVGIVVDDFRETVDIILKPMGGILGGLAGYSGSALLGDGSVLMVLNPKELL